jgi:acetylornithine/N-succinyldiaminopimelate aminotransferase
MKQLGHCSNLFTHAPGIALARTLAGLTGYDQVFFCNSGAEGIEAALKFARVLARARGRTGRELVAFRGGFHGRTGFAVSTTWTPSYREPFEPLIPGVRFADFNDVAALDSVLDENVAAVVVEPVQGEGGGVPATREFLQALRARTTALGAALVLDEVQCGMGRTGRFLASEHFGVRGDFVVLSKALGGGVPLAAVLMTNAAAGALAPGMHGCTFGGNPVAAAAGNFMVGKIANPGFLSKVRKRGRELEAGLARLVAHHPTLAEARGMGLLRAIEVRPDAPFDPPALIRSAREHGLLLVRGGERAVRVLPPLNVTSAEIAEALERLEKALLSLESPSMKGAVSA